MSLLVLRGLMIVGGAVVAILAWPIANAAWQAQKADAILETLRKGEPLDTDKVRAGLRVLDLAVAADPVPGRLFVRSELLAAGALIPGLNVTDSERTEWLRRAKEDVEAGLADAPVRGIDWLRLAALRQAMDGPSRDVLPPLFMSIEVAPINLFAWSARLRLILDNWPYFDDAQKAYLSAYMVRTWRVARDNDHHFFASAIYSGTDELIIRYFLKGQPGAQEELTKMLREKMKK